MHFANGLLTVHFDRQTAQQWLCATGIDCALSLAAAEIHALWAADNVANQIDIGVFLQLRRRI